MSLGFVHLFAVGRVQGVGYREFARRAAEAHGVAGFVRNRADGTVEVSITGEPAKLEAMLADLRRGPMHAQVRELRIVERGAAGAMPTEFRVEATT